MESNHSPRRARQFLFLGVVFLLDGIIPTWATFVSYARPLRFGVTVNLAAAVSLAWSLRMRGSVVTAALALAATLSLFDNLTRLVASAD